MGYDLHITRKDCWAEEEDSRSISMLEWKAYVEKDHEIIKDPDNPDENDYLYLREPINWPLWFNPRLGNIYTKNPDEDVIEKMVKISLALNARVQGDDQEFYDNDGQMVKQESNEIDVVNSANSYERYVKYFFIIVFIASIIWHTAVPDK